MHTKRVSFIVILNRLKQLKLKITLMKQFLFLSRKMNLFFSICSILLLALPGCRKVQIIYQYHKIQPSGPPPAWGSDITPQMLTVIEQLDSLNPVPLYKLTPEQARMRPTPADAVMKVMESFHIPAPPVKVDTMGVQIPVDGGSIHARIYTPTTGKSAYPVIVYYHGGGWVIASIDAYNSSAQALAEQVDAIVVSVEYRKGPEYKFPTAHYDAFTAYKWTLQNAAGFKGDANKIAVAGESAGGNMAVTTAIMARDSGFQKPLHILSVYPVANNDFNEPSYIQYKNAEPLSVPFLHWFYQYYFNKPSDGNSPLISLVNANLKDLSPVTIINAEIDPLQSDGELLEERLQQAGVPVERQLYKGVTHEFFGMATVVPEAKFAELYASQRLKQALY